MKEEYERVLRDCRLGIKAFQNFNASVMGLDRMLKLEGEEDHVILPSLFYWSVIRYAKPFLTSDFDGSKFTYPSRQLKKVEGYSEGMHNHLILVRNKLVAHDDFHEVLPKILTFFMRHEEEKFNIPCSITVSNKIVSFPRSSETLSSMCCHVQACLKGAHEKIIVDMGRLRSMMLENQELAMELARYTQDYGGVKSDSDGNFVKPSPLNDPWLDVSVPDYSVLHDGYQYEEARMSQEYNGPETLITPSGNNFFYHIFPPETN